MAVEFKEIPLGTLNRIDLSNQIISYSITDSSTRHIRRIVEEVSNPSQIKDVQYYIGQVLYVIPNKEKISQPDSYISALNENEITNSYLQQIVVAVPELHTFLPLPKDSSDFSKILKFPIFTAINENVPVPQEGEFVYVDFKNKINLTDGIYLGTLKGAGQTQISNASNQQSILPNTTAREAFNKEFKPFPNFSTNFTRLKDVRNQGTTKIINRHDRFSENRMKQLDTIVLHQTAGSTERNKPILNTEVHLFIDRKGTAYWQYDFELYLATSHNFNSRPSIGIEIEGHMAGVIGAGPKRGLKNFTHWVPEGYYNDPKTSTPEQMTPEQIEAAHQAIRFACKYMQDTYATRIKFLGTHRQTYNVKQSDPGQDVMDKVATPMRTELGLDLFPGTLRDGNPNPEIWGGETGIPYSSEIAATKQSGWIKKTNE